MLLVAQSHTTVRAVRHTAVPILGTIWDSSPWTPYSLPYAIYHWTLQRLLLGCSRHANNQDECFPIDMPATQRHRISLSLLLGFWHSSMISRYTCEYVVLAIRRFQYKAFSFVQGRSRQSILLCNLWVSVSFSHIPIHYSDLSILWVLISSCFWILSVQVEYSPLSSHKRSTPRTLLLSHKIRPSVHGSL